MTWQTKLIAILLVITSLFVWHKYEVSKAITKTVAEQINWLTLSQLL